MFEGKEIDRLIELFGSRRVSLFHACQILDFRSYLRLGGIPSHACLEENRQRFTRLETDLNDQENSVWDKVFVNLSDFGKTFADGYSGIPNPYGPILLQVRPAALCEAMDIAVYLRSAGKKGFNREKEALKSVDDVDKLFQYPAEEGFPRSAWVKFKDQMRLDFPGADEPEMNCTVLNGRLSLRYVEQVLVDPYVIQELPLRERVDRLIQQISKAPLDVRERTFKKKPSRRKLYDELAALVLNSVPSLQDLLQNQDVSTELREWAWGVKPNLEYQFRRFAKYLSEGTLLPLLKR